MAGGLTAGQVTGNGTGSVTLTGTQSEINTTLAAANGVTYTPTPNVNGPDTLTMTSDDGTAQDVDHGRRSPSPRSTTRRRSPATAPRSAAHDPRGHAEPGRPDRGQPVRRPIFGRGRPGRGRLLGQRLRRRRVTANGSNPATGQWQYFNGATWVDIGAASDGAAVLLAASTSIRFNPALDFTGAAPTLTVHLVDASAARSVSGALANLTVTGGTTHYSTGTVMLTSRSTTSTTPPTGVTGDLEAPEDATNGSAVGTWPPRIRTAARSPTPCSTMPAAASRWTRTATSPSRTACCSITSRPAATRSGCARRTIRAHSRDFDMNVDVIDVLGEDVLGDGRDNTFWGGAETDALRGRTATTR